REIAETALERGLEGLRWEGLRWEAFLGEGLLREDLLREDLRLQAQQQRHQIAQQRDELLDVGRWRLRSGCGGRIGGGHGCSPSSGRVDIDAFNNGRRRPPLWRRRPQIAGGAGSKLLSDHPLLIQSLKVADDLRNHASQLAR